MKLNSTYIDAKGWEKPYSSQYPWFKRHPGNGIFYIDAFDASHPTQKRLTRSTGERFNKTLALAIAKDKYNKWQGKPAEFKGRNRKKFKEIAEEVTKLYSNRGVYRKKTESTVKSVVNTRLIPYFGSMWLDEITSNKINAYIADTKKTEPNLNLDNHVKYFNKIMRYAVVEGYIEKRVLFPKQSKREKVGRVISSAQIQALLNVSHPDLRLKIVLGVCHAMRSGEILSLEWDRIDFKTGQITLLKKHTKTKQGRVFPIGKDVISLLKARKKTSHWVFPGRDENDFQTDFRRAWGQCKTLAKISGKLRFHDLRHTYLTQAAKMIKVGEINPVMICQYAGLSWDVFQETYLHIQPHELKPLANIIAVKLREPT